MPELALEETVRLSVPIPKDLANRLTKTIPHGLKANIIRNLMECLASLIEQKGRGMIILLHDGKVGFVLPDGSTFYPSAPNRDNRNAHGTTG